MSESSWTAVDLPVQNTFVHFPQVEGNPIPAVIQSLSDPGPSSTRRSTSPHSSTRTQRAVNATNAIDSAAAPEPERGARPGRRERERMRGDTQQAGRTRHSLPPDACRDGKLRTMIIMGMVVVAICMSVFVQKPQLLDIGSPAKQMMVHSQDTLKQSGGFDNASIAALQDKLQFQEMHIDLSTEQFTGSRSAAKAFVQSSCQLKDHICSTMVAAIDSREVKYHKKLSIPLSANDGSYNAVWMWVQQTDGNDEVQLAFKSTSMSFKLRDVVEYKDQIADEPVIVCDTVSSGWLSSSRTTQTCKETSRKKTVTAIPVFKTTIMSPQEMDLVDKMMENMLAKKVLESANPAAPAVPNLD